MFDGLRTIGKWFLIIAGCLIVLASVLPNGWHEVFAGLGDLINHLHNAASTVSNHAKNR